MMQQQELGPLQKEWLSALRSGDYKQGRKRLYSGGTFCCLGVAMELFSERFRQTGRGGSALSPEVRDKLGLLTVEGHSQEGHHFPSCISMNDSLDNTFDQIASVLETNAHLYFTEPK